MEIKSNFTGTQVVVFGTIERDAQTIARSGVYDVVVTVAGPPTNLVTRRKKRTLGVWINRASEEIRRVPVVPRHPFDPPARRDRRGRRRGRASVSAST